MPLPAILHIHIEFKKVFNFYLNFTQKIKRWDKLYCQISLWCCKHKMPKIYKQSSSCNSFLFVCFFVFWHSCLYCIILHSVEKTILLYNIDYIFTIENSRLPLQCVKNVLIRRISYSPNPFRKNIKFAACMIWHSLHLFI